MMRKADDFSRLFISPTFTNRDHYPIRGHFYDRDA
jgi:hypothetical protein